MEATQKAARRLDGLGQGVEPGDASYPLRRITLLVCGKNRCKAGMLYRLRQGLVNNQLLSIDLEGWGFKIKLYRLKVEEMKLYTLLALLIAITAGVFALQNSTPVFVQFLGWQTQSSMALILLITFSLGVLFGFLISLPTMIQRMRKIAHLRSQADQLAYELDLANRKLLEINAPPTGQQPLPHPLEERTGA